MVIKVLLTKHAVAGPLMDYARDIMVSSYADYRYGLWSNNWHGISCYNQGS